MTITVPASALNFHNFMFEPVKVARGRKFKGFAYFLGCSIRQAGPFSMYDCAKLWDPAAKRFVYANADFCEEVDVPAEEVMAAKLAYVQHDIDGIVNYATANCKGDENDVNKFILNIAKKKYSQEFLNVVFRSQLKITVDVAAEVERTLQWAMSLKTRPMELFGKFCPGGKPLPLEKKIVIAYKALVKKGITLQDDFQMVWSLNCTLLGIPEKILNKIQA